MTTPREHLDRGRECLGRGELARAVAEFSAAIQLAPDLAVAYHFRAGAYITLGDLTAALPDADRAVALDPARQDFRLTRANVHYHLRTPRAAEVDYAESFRMNPQRHTRAVVDNFVTEARDRAAAAVRDCDNHLKFDPDDFSSYARRGIVRLLLGRDAEAAADFAEYARRHPAGVPRLDSYRAEALRRITEAGGTLFSR